MAILLLLDSLFSIYRKINDKQDPRLRRRSRGSGYAQKYITYPKFKFEVIY